MIGTRGQLKLAHCSLDELLPGVISLVKQTNFCDVHIGDGHRPIRRNALFGFGLLAQSEHGYLPTLLPAFARIVSQTGIHRGNA